MIWLAVDWGTSSEANKVIGVTDGKHCQMERERDTVRQRKEERGKRKDCDLSTVDGRSQVVALYTPCVHSLYIVQSTNDARLVLHRPTCNATLPYPTLRFSLFAFRFFLLQRLLATMTPFFENLTEKKHKTQSAPRSFHFHFQSSAIPGYLIILQLCASTF